MGVQPMSPTAVSPVDSGVADVPSARQAARTGASPPEANPATTDRLAKLELEVADLRRILERLADALGASDILK
jgi:hypothetical protein